MKKIRWCVEYYEADGTLHDTDGDFSSRVAAAKQARTYMMNGTCAYADIIRSTAVARLIKTIVEEHD